MTSQIRRLCLTLGATVLGALPALSWAQDNWPSRPVTIVSPYNPGGTNDIPARILAEGFQKIFGQSFIVKNVPGAAGVVGSTQVMSSAPDGYTLLATNNAAMVVQPVVKTPSPYHPISNFTPVARVTDVIAFVGVSGDLPVKNVGELITLAKQQPGKLNYSSAGSGSFGNFVGEYFKLLTGTDIFHIPGKGSAAAVMEMKAGRIQLMFDPIVLPQAADGRVKVLGAISPTRLPNLPQIPTMKEAGGPDVDLSGWYGLFAPAKLPRDIQAKLEAATETIMKDPEIRKKFQDLGLTVNVVTGPKFQASLEADMKLYKDIKERAKLNVE